MHVLATIFIFLNKCTHPNYFFLWHNCQVTNVCIKNNNHNKTKK